MIRRRIVVRGHVQGVWFRESTRQRAEREGVAGWVRNRPDGAVEAVLEGEEAAVERVLAFARRGPRGAHVDHVDESEEAPEGVEGFSVA